MQYSRLSLDDALKRGGQTEFRFFSAMQAPQYGSPHWFRNLRKASRAEDRAGVDAFATLDIGEVPIQIKSSFIGMGHDLARYGDQHCVIVIPRKLAVPEIRDKVFRQLFLWRKRMMPVPRRHRY